MSRCIVIGRNSKVWASLANHQHLSDVIALSHIDIRNFSMESDDKIWILSYSRKQNENIQLFKDLQACGARECAYVSTATANVAEMTNCYEYPRVKRMAENDARKLLDAKIVRIGLVYCALDELPSGRNAATNLDKLALTIANATLEDKSKVELHEMIERPFRTWLEKQAYKIYGSTLNALAFWPCFLRPVDMCLRLIGVRWYGFLYLSNLMLDRSASQGH